RGLHPAVEPERHAGAEGEGRVLAEIVVRGGVTHFDRAALHRIGGLEPRDDLAGSENLDLKFVVGRFGNRLGEGFRSAEDGVERFRIARCEPPFEFGHGLRDCGLGNGRRRRTGRRRSEELSALHWRFSMRFLAMSLRASIGWVKPSQDPREPKAQEFRRTYWAASRTRPRLFMSGRRCES